MIYFLENSEFNFISGIILKNEGGAIVDVNIGVSDMEHPLSWEYPAFRVHTINEGGVNVQFSRPGNWFKFQINIVVRNESVISGMLLYLNPKPITEILDFLKEKRIVFLGAARNCGDSIAPTCEKITELGGFFKEYAVKFFENDSLDNTYHECEKYTRTINNGKLFSETNLDILMPHRTQRLAYARNRLLEDALQHESHFDYLCWVDMDGLVDKRFSTEGFLSNFKYGDVWDAVFPISYPIYYDIWALRDKYISPDDIVWKTKHSVPNMISRKNLHTAPSQLAIDSLNGWLKVESAFGGFGLYKMDLSAKGRYVGIIGGEEACEHVNYNLNLISAGAKFYINPQCITHYQ
jgi:hypothetical protein